MELCFAAAPQVLLPIDGSDLRFPVRRVYCVGRNYAEHAREMGHDPDREPPFFFQKNPDNLDISGQFPYPSATQDLHYEVELAVLLGGGGADVDPRDAEDLVFGYAVALDMTRRDLQTAAKKAARPWAAAKAAEHSAPIGRIVLAGDARDIGSAGIQLAVNGEIRQQARISDMTWDVAEIVAALSRLFTLAPGDVILTGTPAGVGPVLRGDVMEASIDGLPPLGVEVI